MKITVIYHVYNNSSTLEESIMSFAKQTDTDFEFKLVNDGAVNQTIKVLNKIDFSKFKKFQYYNFSQNVGHSFSFNTVLNNLESDYVYYTGSNTIVKPDFIKKIKSLLISTRPDVLSLLNHEANDRLQVFNRPDTQFKKCIGQSTRNKIFSISLLKINNITMDETYYAPLVFIYQALIHFHKWVVYDSNLISFKQNTCVTYNLYDIFQQNQYLIETYSKTKFWKQNQQFMEFLMILFVLIIFLPRMFIQYHDKKITYIAVEKARSWLEKYIPSWRTNKLLKLSLVLNQEVSAYLNNFKFKNKYVINAVKNKVF